mmetsp:Transcript_24623/g.36900  ORF Transcript_24623/g.36900 Transcript_24623/m.36900 type:complete len:286 (+) Transcript_24623:38-895(+)
MPVVGWREAVRLLRESKNVEELSIPDLLDSQAQAQFAQALIETKSPVTVLELAKLGNDGPKVLRRAFEQTKAPIVELDVGCNMIGDEGAEEICSMLNNTGCPISILNLAGNFINDEGIKCIASEIIQKGHKTLTTLDLSENEFGDLGAMYLAESIRSSSCNLVSLDLAHNPVSQSGMQTLLAALLARSSQSSLRILRGLVLNETLARDCGIPEKVFLDIMNSEDRKSSSHKLLTWAWTRIQRAKEVLPMVMNTLKVERIAALVGDFLFWQHPLTKQMYGIPDNSE